MVPQPQQHLLNASLGREKLYVPASQRLKTLQTCHDLNRAGHFGFIKTLYLLKRQFWWPSLKENIESYVASCPTCAAAKWSKGKHPGCCSWWQSPQERDFYGFYRITARKHGETQSFGWLLTLNLCLSTAIKQLKFRSSDVSIVESHHPAGHGSLTLAPLVGMSCPYSSI